MDKFLEAIISGIEKNLKNPKLYAFIAVVIFVCALVFPYIDANYFFYHRIEKRIRILQSISQFDYEEISQEPLLKKEYDAILVEIDQQRNWSISSAAQNSNSDDVKTVMLFKFLSGAVLSLLITLCIPFMNTFKDRQTKVIAFFCLLILSSVLGGIGYLIPTFFNPWINYVGWPILQIVFVAGLAMKPKKTE
ncbi:hypothetical protein [Beduinella massiliensis]|uniref:hypothetical protein n=1 Tax=Beduinella massiliensis TaxID=1852363 RepID=UPI0031F8E9AA